MNQKISFPIAIIIIVILAVVVGGVAIWQYSAMPEIKFPEKTQLKDETADWKTYRNEEYGFEITYPPDWVIEINNAYPHSVLLLPKDFEKDKRDMRFTIDPINVGTDSPFSPQPGSWAGSLSDTIFSSKQAKQYICDFPCTVSPHYSKFIHIEDLKGINWEKGNEIRYSVREDYKSLIPIYEQILSTFRFLEKKEGDNQYNINKYNIFGESKFDIVVSGYLEVKNYEIPEDAEYMGGLKWSNALFVITKFYDENFKKSLDEGIDSGNTVNVKENEVYKFNLGCFESGKIKGTEHEKDKIYMDEETMKKILNSSKENPVSIVLSFGLHGGFGCFCCNLAHQVRIYDETADWKTYRNEEYGFEIKYPSISPIPQLLDLKPKIIFNPSSGINNCFYSRLSQIIQEEKIRLGKNEFCFSLELDSGLSQKEKSYYYTISDGNNSFVLFFEVLYNPYCGQPDNLGCTSYNEENAQKIFNQIISTFEFLE